LTEGAIPRRGIMFGHDFKPPDSTPCGTNVSQPLFESGLLHKQGGLIHRKQIIRR
jgi:hypothetical protein